MAHGTDAQSVPKSLILIETFYAIEKKRVMGEQGEIRAGFSLLS